MYFFDTHTTVCPVCQSVVSFRSNATNINTCSNCHSMLQRTKGEAGLKTTHIGYNQTLANTTIPLGARGIYNGKNFEVIGACYCDMTRFFNNRFTILFTDGSLAWLTETMGFYAILQKAADVYSSKLPLLAGMDIAQDKIELQKGSQQYLVDKSKSEKTYACGEIHSPDTDGIFTAYELADGYNQRLEVIEYAKGNFEVYNILYCTPAELQLQPLNTTAALVLPCDSCTKPVQIVLPQYSNHVVCPACFAWNELQGVDRLKSKNKKFNAFNPLLPVGSCGQLKNIDYKITGATRKYETGSINTEWTEYTLYNPQNGFAFLAEYNGHWTYLKEVKINQPWPVYQQEIIVNNEQYVLFNDYTFRIKEAAGEFYSTLGSGTVMAKEYISPPEMYAVEKNDTELTWYKAAYTSNQEIFEAFGTNATYQHGIGPLQPMKGYINMGLLKQLSLVAFTLLFCVQVFFSLTAKNTVLLEQNFLLPDSLPAKAIVTTAFEVKPRLANLEFEISAPVNNSWFNADITLVNKQNGKEYPLDKGVEFYHGYSGGEKWSEGSTSTDALLSSIPAGIYHLNIFPSQGGNYQINSFSIAVRSDVPMWRNFIFIVLLASIFPLLQWTRHQVFERRRWNNSPHNPFNSEEA
ncbi:MAG: hypothetical protein RL172_2265 [Bacteroidota bacterium]